MDDGSLDQYDDGEATASDKDLKECCIAELGGIEYRKTKQMINGHALNVEEASGDLHYCSSCGKVLGSCPWCGNNYEFPLLSFINEGKDGMIPLCQSCFLSLGLLPELKPGGQNG